MKRKNALLCGLLAVVLLCGLLPIHVPAQAAFVDVPEGAWYAEAVNWCREHSIVNDGTAFSPETVMTRAMVATALYRASGSPAAAAQTDFTDVSAGSPYAAAVSWAAETGVVNGYDDGTFKPDNPVTRQQFAAMLWRSAGSPTADAGTDYADENTISTYAKTAVDWARDAGVILGKDGNRFDPQGGATRAQAAVILYRYLTLNKTSQSPDNAENTGKTVLVAYFSATGTTKGIAEQIAEITGADLYEITPNVPYTSADLNYSDRSSRATVEQNDASARPAIFGPSPNVVSYRVVFLGYPIWWGQAPRIISTFLESCDFNGKIIVPFCTSGSSPIGNSADNLYSLTSGADWKAGRRFAGNSTRASVEEWVSGLNLPKNEETLLLDWPEITENGVDEEVLFAQIDRDVLETIAFELQTLVQEEMETERRNPEIVLSEGWTRVFRSERYQKVLDMGQKAVKPLYWIIYKSPNAGLYEYICADALYHLTGYHFEGENGVLTWNTSKELITRINERVLADTQH